jgi:hypothetical protein
MFKNQRAEFDKGENYVYWVFLRDGEKEGAVIGSAGIYKRGPSLSFYIFS